MTEKQPLLKMLPKAPREREGEIPWLPPYYHPLVSHWSFSWAEPNWKPVGKEIKPPKCRKKHGRRRELRTNRQ